MYLPICLAVTRRLILASASPARLRVLQWAGLAPEVMVSGVDEEVADDLPTAEAVLVLARRKAIAVAARLGRDGTALVIGCDSLLEFDGRPGGEAGIGGGGGAVMAEAADRNRAAAHRPLSDRHRARHHGGRHRHGPGPLRRTH